MMFKCCCLQGKLRHHTKHISRCVSLAVVFDFASFLKFVTLFVYTGIDEILSRHFFKLGAWRGQISGMYIEFFRSEGRVAENAESTI